MLNMHFFNSRCSSLAFWTEILPISFTVTNAGAGGGAIIFARGKNRMKTNKQKQVLGLVE